MARVSFSNGLTSPFPTGYLPAQRVVASRSATAARQVGPPLVRRYFGRDMKRREKIFRTTSAIVVGLMSLGLALGLRDNAGAILGDIPMLVATGLLLGLFSTYAVLGPKKANSLLARILQLHRLPETIWHRLVGRHVEMPILEDEERRPPLEDVSNEESNEPS